MPLPGTTPGATREGSVPITGLPDSEHLLASSHLLRKQLSLRMIANSTKELDLGVPGSRKLAAAPKCMWTRQTFLKGREQNGHHHKREVLSGALHTNCELLLAGPVTITH